MEILGRISKNDMQIDVNEMLGAKALEHTSQGKRSVSNLAGGDQNPEPKTININKSVEKMFNHML